MYISRLRLKGFKSFGGNHEIELSPGYTAIVGPNGSGKSNLLDAIRWVLGDPTPARLRIQRQSDLLFQGSISLPPSLEAESTLQLCAPSGLVTLRRTYSTGNGTLLTYDGNRIRLQDLQEIKSALKLEGEQFAFIGQGEVAEAIRHRPFQRRVHLESLFGIDKYRKKRDEANRKLELASSELLRLQTLMSELQNRRKQIEPNVKKASQAKVFMQELDEQRRVYYFARTSHLETKLNDLSEKAAHIQHEAVAKLFWSQIWNQAFHKYQVKKKQIEEELDKGHEVIEQIQFSRDAIVRNCFSTATSLKNARNRVMTIEKEEKRILEDMANLENEKRSSSDQEQTLISDLENKEELLERLKKEYAAKCKLFEQEENKKREQKRRFFELSQQKDKFTLKTEKNIRYLRNLKNREKALQREILDLEVKDKERKRDLDKLTSRFALIKEQHSQVYTQCQQIAGKLQIHKKEQRNLDVNIDDLRTSVEDRGYPEPVRFLTSAARLARLEVFPVPVIEAFSAPERLAQALDSFLGGKLFWLIVDSVDEAQTTIEYLKKKGAGRVTMLPLERCRTKSPHSIDLVHQPGVIGWAMDLISVREKWMPALKHLMGDVLFIDTFFNARKLVSRKIRFPLVTLDGEVFSPQGSISGGYRRKGPGIVEQKIELEKKREQYEANIICLKQLAEDLEATEEKEENLAADKEMINRETNELSSVIKQNEIQMASFRSELTNIGKDILNSTEKMSRFWNKRRQVQSEYRALGATIGDDDQDRSGIEKLKAQVASQQNIISILKEKLQSSRLIIKRITNEYGRLDRTLAEISSETMDLENHIAESSGKLRRKGLKSLELWTSLNSERSKIRLGHQLLAAHREKADLANSRYNEASEILRLVENDQNRLEQESSSITRDIEQLKEMWEEKFPSVGNIDLSQVDQGELQNRIGYLEKKVRAFGEIDQGCLSENKSLNDRISYLDEQIGDVMVGTEDLKKMIDSLDDQVETIFRGALKKVDNRFDALFKRLFGGGEAHLMIQEGASIWECGVDIFARPPGKKLQNLNQLSGGEQSLTAISLLFASMEVAEVPLAILDEVDAALDDVNLGRFVDLIQDYASSLQLLIMTHRRITMENAHIMYGVTMKEPGLSQIVGVKMDDWK